MSIFDINPNGRPPGDLQCQYLPLITCLAVISEKSAAFEGHQIRCQARPKLIFWTLSPGRVYTVYSTGTLYCEDYHGLTD